jgi:hypothetical protein
MSEIKAGGKLVHVRAPGFVNETVDQLVGLTYSTGNEHRFAMTFGRDQLTIDQETLNEVAPGVFQARPSPEDYTLTRVDFATLTMNLDAAKRFRDALNQMIDAAESTPHPTL